MMHFIVMFKEADRLVTIKREMRDSYGIGKNGLSAWKGNYHQSLAHATRKLDLNKVGGPNEVCVFDETVIGVHKAVNTRARRDRSSTRRTARQQKHYIKERLPARTVYKKPAGKVVKKPAAALKRPAASPGSS